MQLSRSYSSNRHMTYISHTRQRLTSKPHRFNRLQILKFRQLRRRMSFTKNRQIFNLKTKSTNEINDKIFNEIQFFLGFHFFTLIPWPSSET